MTDTFDKIHKKLDCLRGSKVSVAQIMECMAASGFPSTLIAISLMIILVPVPKVLPLNIFFTLPFVYIGWQMFKGEKEPTFPNWLAAQEFKNHKVKATANKVFKIIEKFEGYAKPAMPRILAIKNLPRYIGIVILVLTLSMILPLPFTSTMPAILICMMALGQIHEDGRLILAGVIGSAVWMIVLTCLLGEILDETGDVLEWTWKAVT